MKRILIIIGMGLLLLGIVAWVVIDWCIWADEKRDCVESAKEDF